MEHEVPLTGGRVTPGVVQVGDTVRRPVKAQAGFVHELLRHLERRGFSGAPRFLGIDGAGREMLSFIPGSVPAELGHFSDDQLTAAARLLREFHDATVDFASRDGFEVVCHGDASPCNCVFVEGRPAALIDFDEAHGGSRLEDLGYACWLWTDIGNDELPADLQGRRVARFFSDYGSEGSDAVDSIIRAQEALGKRSSVSGVVDWADACRTWVVENRGALAAAVAASSKSRRGLHGCLESADDRD